MQANSPGTSDTVELTRDGIKSCLNICWSNCTFFCLKEGSVLSNVWLHVVTKLLIPCAEGGIPITLFPATLAVHTFSCFPSIKPDNLVVELMV